MTELDAAWHIGFGWGIAFGAFASWAMCLAIMIAKRK